MYELYGFYEEFIRAQKSARFSIFARFYVIFKRIVLQNRGNLVYEWAGVILRPGPLVPMLTHGRQGQGAVVRRIALDGAETTWPGLFQLPGFLRQSRDLPDNMRSCRKISNNLQSFSGNFFEM